MINLSNRDDGPCSKNSNFVNSGHMYHKPNGDPVCECPTCSEEFKPICGRYDFLYIFQLFYLLVFKPKIIIILITYFTTSDGISYPNECKMRRELCEQKNSWNLLYWSLCSESYIILYLNFITFILILQCITCFVRKPLFHMKIYTFEYISLKI